MVFRFKNCSDLWWEKIVLLIKKNVGKFKAEGKESAKKLDHKYNLSKQWNFWNRLLFNLLRRFQSDLGTIKFHLHLQIKDFEKFSTWLFYQNQLHNGNGLVRFSTAWTKPPWHLHQGLQNQKDGWIQDPHHSWSNGIGLWSQTVSFFWMLTQSNVAYHAMSALG